MHWLNQTVCTNACYETQKSTSLWNVLLPPSTTAVLKLSFTATVTPWTNVVTSRNCSNVNTTNVAPPTTGVTADPQYLFVFVGALCSITDFPLARWNGSSFQHMLQDIPTHCNSMFVADRVQRDVQTQTCGILHKSTSSVSIDVTCRFRFCLKAPHRQRTFGCVSKCTTGRLLHEHSQWQSLTISITHCK